MREERMRRRALAQVAVTLTVVASVGVGLDGCAAQRRPEPGPSSAPTPARIAERGSVLPAVRPHADALTAAAEAKVLVAAMSPGELAGAVLMTAGTVPELPGLRRTVSRYHLGGVMVRGRSTIGTAAVRRGVNGLQAASSGDLPMLVATDQEGGSVQVLRGPGFSSIPSAVRQARWSRATLQRRAGGWGRALRAAGINLNLAPVGDTPCPSTVHDNPPIADLDRNYGADPAAAGRAVAAVVRGLGGAGIATTVKHFPGLGCVRANTDTAASVVDRVLGARSPRLRPFRSGITAGASVVMVSSARYARIDARHPALFSSRIIDSVLRGRMGFRGVVMSDDVGGARAVAAYSAGSRATRFVSAGGDLLLDIVPAHVPEMAHALRTRAADDARFRARLRAAATRVTELRLSLAR